MKSSLRVVGRRACSEFAPRFPETQVSLDVVGEYSLTGKRMSAGAMLGMMDIGAVRAAHSHAKDMTAAKKATYSTVAVDDCNFLGPVMHGDLVKVEATPVLAGNSSITVDVSCFRRSLRSREWHHLQRATFVIVTIDSQTLKKVTGVPALVYTDPNSPENTSRWQDLRDRGMKRREVLRKWEEEAKEVRAMGEEGRALLVPPEIAPNTAVLPISTTKITLRRMFLPRFLNFNDTVFGGDLLEWMETGAIYSAMNFTGHNDIVTISMNRVVFKEPLTKADWVSLDAEVVFVSKHTIHVDVKVSKEHEGGHSVTHFASFVFMGMSMQTGRKEPVMTSLQIPHDDLHSLQKHHSAFQRYMFWKKNQSVKHAQISSSVTAC
eukprot:TRINITY_DN13610_c0_g1_i1.p1 TRINITY_DN13610_c0_g1~~TRINITY_DN13610_c0_g1_i1.p1  ORF type:complete len:377 (+),score=145.28 TRINITY_DN13610_c0_g1_i1:271-1401(+)